MHKDRVRIEGAQFMSRESGGGSTPLHQLVRAEIASTDIRIEFEGSESGQVIAVPSDDPAVIRHYRELDHAQLVVSISNRPPVPEPRRVPMIAGPGLQARQCWLCEGRGTVEDGEGWQDCAACEGAGLLPLEIPHE